MGFNLVEGTRAHFSPDVGRRLARGLGEEPDAVERGFDAALPEVAGGIVEFAATPDGARSLCDALIEGGFDGALLARLSAMLDGDVASRQLAARGAVVLQRLFGKELAPLNRQLASFSGLQEPSAEALLGMVAAVSMAVLGQHRQRATLDAEGLRTLLREQRDPERMVTPVQVDRPPTGAVAGDPGDLDREQEARRREHASLAPEGEAMARERAELVQAREARARETEPPPASMHAGDAARIPGAAGPEVPPAPVPHRRIEPVRSRDVGINPGRWFLPAALAVLVIVGWSLLRNGREARRADALVAEQAQQRQARGEGERPRDPSVPPRAAGLGALTLPDGTVLRAPQDGGAYRLATALAQRAEGASTGGSGEAGVERIAFPELSFPEGGSTLDGRALVEVDRLAQVLVAYPEARVRLEGHTGGTGEAANRPLSQQRADAVRAALEERGIAHDRIETRGHGDSDPVASADSEAGRRANARTDVILLR